MPIGQPVFLPIPLRGRPYGVPPQSVGDDQLSDAQNVYIEDGALRDRRGFQPYSTTNTLSSGLVGIAALVPMPADRTVASGAIAQGFAAAVSGSRWHHQHGPGLAYQDIGTTTVPSLAAVSETIQVAAQYSYWSFPVGTSQATVVTNRINTPAYYLWSESPSGGDNLTSLAAAPASTDGVISSASRLVAGVNGVNGTTEIHVSAVADMTTWPSGLFALIDDTPDIFVGFSPIDRTSFLVHKTQSQWIATSTPNAAFPFRFDKAGSFIGPISNKCIVYAANTSYWLGNDGIIYRLSGSSFEPINDDMASFIIANIEPRGNPLAHGSYVANRKQVWWFYSQATTFFAESIIVYDIRTNTAWHQKIASVDGSIGASLGWPVQDANNEFIGMLVGDALGQTDAIHMLRDGGGHAAGDADFSVIRGDGGGIEVDGTAISAMFQTAVRAYAGPQRATTIRGYVPLFRKEASSANLITIEFLGGDHPNNLSTLETKTVDPSATDRIAIDGLNVKANWVAVKHSWTIESDHGRIWDGGILYVDAIDEGVR